MDAPDRFSALVDALAAEPGVTPPDGDGGRRFGAGTLRAEGSIFAMLVSDAVVLKLPRARVVALLADGSGRPFGNGRGQPYREWVALPDGEPGTDLALAREALAFVRSRRR
ncbi:hypothetical protein ACI78V_19095 [Geodermatophilus sp. SYSU D00742]